MTSGWISAAMSKKTEIWNGNDTYSMFFGDKGRDMVPMLRHACERYKDNLEKMKYKIELLDSMNTWKTITGINVTMKFKLDGKPEPRSEESRHQGGLFASTSNKISNFEH